MARCLVQGDGFREEIEGSNRVMNARGNALLEEEKERNRVNKQLPKIEGELNKLIEQWELSKGTKFLVSGVDFKV